MNIIISKEEKEEIDNILSTRENKEIYYLLKPYQSAPIGTMWLYHNDCKWENICKPFNSLHGIIMRNNKEVGYNIIKENGRKLVKIDYNKIKIKE